MTGPTPDAIFKLLADETRLRMLLLIQEEQELCVCELVTALSLSQPKISRHLAVLRNAGLLMDRRQGQWVYYRLAEKKPAWLGPLLAGISASYIQWRAPERDALETMPNRPGCC